MRGNEGVIGGCCRRHGGLSLRLRPAMGRRGGTGANCGQDLNFQVAGFDPNSNRIPLTAFVTYWTNGRRAMANRANHYRRRARECLKLANVVPRGKAHDTVISMAREWARLAYEEERASKGQQQQQIQPDDKKE
jgi:hypothetical protein